MPESFDHELYKVLIISEQVTKQMNKITDSNKALIESTRKDIDESIALLAKVSENANWFTKRSLNELHRHEDDDWNHS